MLKRIKKHIAEICCCDIGEIGDDMDLTPMMDSLDIVELHVALEEEFDIGLEDEVLFKVFTPNQIKKELERIGA